MAKSRSNKVNLGKTASRVASKGRVAKAEFNYKAAAAKEAVRDKAHSAGQAARVGVVKAHVKVHNTVAAPAIRAGLKSKNKTAKKAAVGTYKASSRVLAKQINAHNKSTIKEVGRDLMSAGQLAILRSKLAMERTRDKIGRFS